MNSYLGRMTQRTLQDKLAILSDAAKYDASCASSGGERRHARAGERRLRRAPKMAISLAYVLAPCHKAVRRVNFNILRLLR